MAGSAGIVARASGGSPESSPASSDIFDSEDLPSEVGAALTGQLGSSRH